MASAFSRDAGDFGKLVDIAVNAGDVNIPSDQARAVIGGGV
jgi:hypothetical protein